MIPTLPAGLAHPIPEALNGRLPKRPHSTDVQKPQLHIWLWFRLESGGSTGASVVSKPTQAPCSASQAAALLGPGTDAEWLKTAGLFQEGLASSFRLLASGVSQEADGLHGWVRKGSCPGRKESSGSRAGAGAGETPPLQQPAVCLKSSRSEAKPKRREEEEAPI